MASRILGGVAEVRVVASPPAWEGLAIDVQRVGQPDQVGEHSLEGCASWGPSQQMGTDPGQPVDHIVFGQSGKLAAGDAANRLVHSTVRQRAYGSVQDVQSASVPAGCAGAS